MRYFITGGAGFIGCNLSARKLAAGDDVTLFDNLSRPRTEHNLEWLREQFGDAHLSFIKGDIRDYETLRTAVEQSRPDVIVHLASQVAVTTSVKNPREDFEINALGTFNVLEAARAAARAAEKPPAVFYASTNKVYGGMEDVAVVQEATRYRYRDLAQGVSEHQPLDFHSPYGCSKGAGDQYVRDYARIYGLRTVVFRQSCIYGERQFGVEDQGWVAHFVIAAALGRPITIYGDGKQVRDLLYVQDLIDAYDAAWEHIEHASGQVFNIGGGPANTLSIWAEFGPLLESLAGRPIPVRYGAWRPGDQPVFVSDNSKAKALLGWEPRTSVHQGIERLWRWVTAHPALFN
ncbi:MAG: GDP-mannose 4,6-dehydratase [Anaerolineae bacterium]|nr:GDP-mannose 4,6-dehydratase [Thermoflexales bacterium]MDW8407494.1 GDP-mannose 4,6-dehydratase [Anaerolineae bacterium]